MKKLLLVLAVVAGVAVPAAGAGGWATVGLSELPGNTPAGGTWDVDLTVLQHGVTPLQGVTPVITITNGGGESRQFTGTPAGKAGVYHADVVFPSSGTWSYEIWDGFSRTHTFKPVEITAPGDGSFALVRVLPAFAFALVLATATILYLRRGRPRPEPVRLKEAA